MKERRHVYFYVGTKRPTHELLTDSWGCKRMYLHDDVFDARTDRDVLNNRRKKGQPRNRIYRVRFVEVW